jgi:hypothetical protein
MIVQRETEGGTQAERALRREQIVRKELQDERRRNANLVWTIENGPQEDIEPRFPILANIESSIPI